VPLRLPQDSRGQLFIVTCPGQYHSRVDVYTFTLFCTLAFLCCLSSFDSLASDVINLKTLTLIFGEHGGRNAERTVTVLLKDIIWNGNFVPVHNIYPQGIILPSEDCKVMQMYIII
jgi:hypothetical protein